MFTYAALNMAAMQGTVPTESDLPVLKEFARSKLFLLLPFAQQVIVAQLILSQSGTLVDMLKWIVKQGDDLFYILDGKLPPILQSCDTAEQCTVALLGELVEADPEEEGGL